MRECRRNSKSNIIRKDATYVLFTVLLVLGLSFFVSETVMSQSEKTVAIDEEYYQVLEQEYVKEIRNYLNQKGYCNSGVNLFCIIQEDGSRDYEIRLYHKKLIKLSEQEKLAILGEVE